MLSASLNKTFPSFSMLQSIETNALGFTLQLLETLFNCALKFTCCFFLYHKFVFVSGFHLVCLSRNPFAICKLLWGQLVVLIAPRRRTRVVSSLYVVFHIPSVVLGPLLVALTGRSLLVSKVQNDAFINSHTKTLWRDSTYFSNLCQVSDISRHWFQWDVQVELVLMRLVGMSSKGMFSDPCCRYTGPIGGAGFNQIGGHGF